eukprot:gnl/TRDRNA2_/TRDRNA2_146401_c1_seq3.p1 gnl/TRDRNA2_/TRDRNA2_146401_c1~~gnl/TRDRNA2_/TRDRNA2_146401_c1_seq3.p1  ORF type:complete len:103 (-),score=20.71 gnl/TRDRNA2_/TRDRNA2_146401_c1_seq3:222-530(-)
MVKKTTSFRARLHQARECRHEREAFKEVIEEVTPPRQWKLQMRKDAEDDEESSPLKRPIFKFGYGLGRSIPTLKEKSRKSDRDSNSRGLDSSVRSAMPKGGA